MADDREFAFLPILCYDMAKYPAVSVMQLQF